MLKMNIKFVAKKAGVSVATISRAMNPETRHKVAPKTLEKIDVTVRECGYTPNIAAKNLRQMTTKRIGVIFPYFRSIFYNSYYIHILSGVSDYLWDTPYQFKPLMLKEEKNLWEQYDFRSGERVDGVIIIHWSKFFSVKSIVEKINVPSVVINDFDKDLQTTFVCADHYKGAQLAAEHFYKNGHRHFAVMKGSAWSKDSIVRLQGFQDYLKAFGVTIPEELIVSADYKETDAYEQIETLLKRKRKFTALFCCNDTMAFGVLRKLEKLKIAVPEEISVIGYDDDIHSQDTRPALTTIGVPLYQMAQTGTKLLINYLEKKNFSKPFVGVSLLPVELMERKSVCSRVLI